MSDLAAVRRAGLAGLLTSRGFVRVADASLELGVSEVTIRADLTALEREGRAVRVHGGAMPADPLHREAPVEATRDERAVAKRAIGEHVAAMVSSGDCVYLDAGSTAQAVAEALLRRRELRDLVVVTSALPIALALEPAIPRYEVVVTGGTLRPLQHSLVNPFAAPMLDALRFDLAVIGCTGVDARHGATNVNLPEAEIKSLVLRSAQRAVLVADASKLGRVDPAVIAPPDRFDALVTAGDPPADELDALRAGGLDAVVLG
ncbi:MAG: DeoR/GlpR transcriptional regulator [Microbacteriaceae bacterium]|nr:DeoR/GlpR transcriptional regulator [Microbacteriaceae bacterium]